ncbi:MAG TPA: glutaminyl-peptide cyclotransferase [Vicinamibacterales bacterium]|nr:glutaminyl-peptide cyclotransferase [Vicinamibacterales bacterium]
MVRPLAAALLMASIGFIPARRGVAPIPAPTYTYKVVRSYPHDRSAFTQGLIARDGFFYEGTGLNGRSGIRKVRIETGEVVQIQPLPQEYFGEGITDWKGQLFQLTWRSEIGFVYDLATFERTRTFAYKGEGWGLTHDDAHIIMSDGSADLRFLDPVTAKETGRLTVRDQNGPVEQLNELEYVKGEIYANVWQTERIARISPRDGHVVAWIDLRGLLTPAERAGTDVLNGIAYEAASDRLFVTGKLWPRVFEIKLQQQ